MNSTKTKKKKQYGLSSLSKKQRILFNEYFKANKRIFKDCPKSAIIPIWLDGYVCGKYSHTWKRKKKK